jgi:prepilin-type N-terminal cleavage/methylation domain-containing protein
MPMKLRNQAYTLIEVLAAAAIVAIGATAAATLSASLGLQEEYARRVAVVRNHQENMAQLWQLGLGANEIAAIMPTKSGNRNLTAALHATPVVIEMGQTTLGTAPNTVILETALCRASVNVAQDPQAQQEGSPFELVVCRPAIR